MTEVPPETTAVTSAPPHDLIDSAATSPADARVGGGPQVWAVIGNLRINQGDIAATAAAYALSLEAVQAALAYYWRHQTIIDGRLAEHAAFFEPTPS
jgi:hypothetical protein